MSGTYVEFVLYIIRSLVRHPESVNLERSSDDMGILLVLDVDKEDMGRIIGARGETMIAIRKLVRIVGLKEGARVSLKLKEPGEHA